MIEELFHIGSFSVSPFGLLMMAGFVAGGYQLLWGLRRLEIGGADEANALVVAAGVWGLVGGKLYYSGLHGDWRLSLDWLRSGLVWYGGFIAATIAVLWVVRRRRMPVWSATDALAPAVALGYGVGRIGCFLVGDDYGMPTALPWGVKFPFGLPGPTTAGFMRREYGAEVAADVPAERLIAVHPTQLYETIAAIAIWWVGRRLILRGLRPGTVALVVLGLLAVERFAVEILRAKDDRLFGGFTVAQAVSVGIVVVLAALWPRRPRPA